jgi:hypothetical protein
MLSSDMKKSLITFTILASLVSCNHEVSTLDSAFLSSDLRLDTLAVIGGEDQAVEYQLGDPVSIITIEEEIFIADNASLKIKVFDHHGKYVRSIGGRGRGPGEFQNIKMMSLSSNDAIFVQDRGKLEYIHLTVEGEQRSASPENLTPGLQYYPERLEWFNNHSIGLMQSAGPLTVKPQPIDRPLFYVYDEDIRTREATFFSFRELGYSEQEMFVWKSFIPLPGSFDVQEKSDPIKLIYSPGVYSGQLYEFELTEGLQWKLMSVLNTSPLSTPSFEIYEKESKYESMKDFPGVNQIRFLSIPSWGRIYAVDAGVYYLSDGGIIQFYGAWTEGDLTLEEGNALKLFAQVLSPDGQIMKHGYLMDIQMDSRPNETLVNWKDEQDNFYLLNVPKDDVPTVMKFRLDVEELADSGQ